MRRKPWARPELAAAAFVIDNPREKIGVWRDEFVRKDASLWIELGCGKGVSTAELCCENPNINLIAVDIKSEVLAVAKRNAEKEYTAKNREIDNLLLFTHNIEEIDMVFAKSDKVNRILINFCNPWPKKKSKKHRLTYPRQLERYKEFMAPDCLIVFKTDDEGLFEESIIYFTDSGFEICELIEDLPEDHIEAMYLSEHEKFFRSKGLKIYFLTAKLK